MRHPFHILLAFIAFPFYVYGRLGETEQELVARFGPPVSRAREVTLTQSKIIEFGSKLIFRQGDWTIESVMIEGRCAREEYWKAGEWTEDQFVTVLTSNAQGEKWTDLSKAMTKGLMREWHRGDGATAVWSIGTHMMVTHPAYVRAKKRVEDKAKAEASQIPKI